MTNQPGIYRIVNTVSGRTYLGSSVKVQKRLYRHAWQLGKGTHDNRHLQAAWLKYGAQAFIFELLLHCSEADLARKEQDFIDAYIDHGMEVYNLAPSSESRHGFRYEPTLETRAKLSAIFKGRTGHIVSMETRQKISASTLGRPKQPFSIEHRMKIGAVTRGKKTRPCREDTKDKIRLSLLGKSHPESRRATNSLSHTGLRLSAATRARMVATRTGQKRGPYRKKAVINDVH